MSARIRLGILGWGIAGRSMARAAERSDRFTIAGVADISPQARAAAGSSGGLDSYPSLRELMARARPEVVYIATPTPQHAEAVAELAAAGMHVVCEKPLAATWNDAVAACAAAEAAAVVLLVGNTHSYDAPVQELRRLVLDGSLGALVTLQSAVFTNWRTRPRKPDDLDADKGGGIVLRQGAHQLDVARLVGGGQLTTVSAQTFGGAHGTEAGYAALAGFASGATASLSYCGTGGFDSAWLTQGVGELGIADHPMDPISRQYFRLPCRPVTPAPTFGLMVATFTAGQAVLTSRGVLAYTPDGPRDHLADGRPSGWDAVLSELAGVLEGKPAIHSGRWGLATLEASLAVHQSARRGGPIALSHQVPLPPGR
jgi:phthalate 4,5-cis-dihydrodiol dehydrogenase